MRWRLARVRCVNVNPWRRWGWMLQRNRVHLMPCWAAENVRLAMSGVKVEKRHEVFVFPFRRKSLAIISGKCDSSVRIIKFYYLLQIFKVNMSLRGWKHLIYEYWRWYCNYRRLPRNLRWNFQKHGLMIRILTWVHRLLICNQMGDWVHGKFLVLWDYGKSHRKKVTRNSFQSIFYGHTNHAEGNISNVDHFVSQSPLSGRA